MAEATTTSAHEPNTEDILMRVTIDNIPTRIVKRLDGTFVGQVKLKDATTKSYIIKTLEKSTKSRSFDTTIRKTLKHIEYATLHAKRRRAQATQPNLKVAA